MDSQMISSARGNTSKIHHITASYNSHTKEAYLYMELQRADKKYLESHMIHMGATSVNIKTFSADNWVEESFNALNAVKSYASYGDFVLVQTASSPHALFIGKTPGTYVFDVEN
jgi:hypothetical protein